jgi:hypothetical protein
VAGAVGAAAGSIASQVVGVAMGAQDSISWRGVALSALSGGVGGSLANVDFGLGIKGNFVARATLGNALTQGIGVVTGLQDKFDWRGVAASAVGAAVGQAVGGKLGRAWGGTPMGDFAARAVTGLAAGTAAAVMRGGKIAIQQVATDAFGNALGYSVAEANWGGQQDNQGSVYNDGDIAMSELRFSRGYRNNFARVNALMDSVPSFDDPAQGVNDRFEGVDVAGTGAGRDFIRKVGASRELQAVTDKIYNGLDDINAAVSMGNPGLPRIRELQASGFRTLAEQRDVIRNSPALMQEILDRGLTFDSDIEQVGMLGAFGNSDTVHRIAVATARAGGAGRATAQGIATQLGELDSFGSTFVNRMPGDMSVERAAPGVYLNTLLGLRSHVDSTTLYIGSMSDHQFAQLGEYTDTVIGSGGMTNYKQNEALAAAWTSLQGSARGYAHIGEGLSVASLGLRNVAGGLGEAMGRMAMGEGVFANSTFGRLLFPAAARPLYAVSPGPSLSAEGEFIVGKHGDMPSPRPGQHSHHGVMSAWMKANYPGYDPDLAPAVLMPEASHRATFGVYNKWRAEMRQEMGGTFEWSKVPEPGMRSLSNNMFEAASMPATIRQQYWEWFDRMKGALTK